MGSLSRGKGARFCCRLVPQQGEEGLQRRGGRLLPVERAGELPEKPHLRHGPHLEAALPLGQGLRQDGHPQAGFGCLGQSGGAGALQQGLGRQALLGKHPVYRAAQAAARFPQEQGQGRQLFYGGRGGKAPRGRRQDQVLLIEGLGPQPFRNPQAVYNAHIQLVLR